MSANDEKIFHLYPDMFPELKKMVVEEMEPVDRCRFTRCSKLSQKEAKSSKNYIVGLGVSAFGKSVKISISHSKHHEFDQDYKGFTLEFGEENGNKYRRCKTRRGYVLNEEIWREDMDNSIDVIEYGAELFKNLMRDYQNIIKRLSFFGAAFSGRLKNYDFEIRSLNKLKSLRIEHDLDILYYLSKLKRPLKHLTVDGGRGDSYLADREEIYQITDSVVIPGIKITYEQMLRLRARTISIPFGDITEMEICNVIRSWQNGTLGKKLGRCLWINSRDKTFDIPKLFRLLGLNGDFTPAPEFNINEMESYRELRRIQFVIDHNHNAMLKGILWCDDSFGQLIFDRGYIRR